MTYRQKTNTTYWIKNIALAVVLLWIKADVSDIRDAVKKVPLIEAQQAQAVKERDEMKVSIGVITTDVKTINTSVFDLKTKVDNVYSLFDEWGFKQAMK